MKISLKKCTFLAVIFAMIAVLVVSFNVNTASAAAERRYTGYGNGASTYALESTNEYVNFTSREEEYIETVKGVPLYMPISDLDNCCGAVAGSIIVGFYDKYYENLIPNYKTYLITGRYRGIDGTYIPKTMRELYTLMRTNMDDVGVSQSDCVNGLKAYINNYGYNAQLTSIRSNKIVDETAFRNAVNQNKPTLLFCDKLEAYFVVSSDTSDKIVKTYITQNGHVAVGYGLYIVKYYNGDQLFRTDKYIKIATGLYSTDPYYLKLEETDWCNGAYEVSVW